MEHTQNNNKSGLRIAIWLIAFVGIAYLVSPTWSSVFARYKSNNTSTSSYTAPQWGGGCPMMGNFQKSRANATPTNNVIDSTVSYETVNVGHTAFALNPETVTLKAGKSYKLVITPTEDGWGCMNSMTIPGIDNKVYPIKKGEPITIIINNAKTWTYKVVCGAMGMYQWQIVVK